MKPVGVSYSNIEKQLFLYSLNKLFLLGSRARLKADPCL